MLSGSNSYSGGTTLNAGTLDINSASALGNGLFVNNGGSFDNTSGTAVTLAGVTSQFWGGNLNFVGSNSLNFGTGGVTLGANSVTVADNGGNLTENGAISGAGALIQTGTGTLTLGGASNFGYKGDTFTINGGTVNVNSASAFGNANNTVNFAAGAGVTLGNTSGTAVTLANYTYDYRLQYYLQRLFQSQSLGNGTINVLGNHSQSQSIAEPLIDGREFWTENGNAEMSMISPKSLKHRHAALLRPA